MRILSNDLRPSRSRSFHLNRRASRFTSLATSARRKRSFGNGIRNNGLPNLMQTKHFRMTIIDPELDDRSYSHLLTLLSVSAAMVGVCLTAVGLVSVIEALNKIQTWVDDLLAIGSLVFSIVTLLSFLGIRTRIRRWKRFTLVLDVLFCLGISAMVVASLLLTYFVI